jgi:hypothetical protein
MTAEGGIPRFYRRHGNGFNRRKRGVQGDLDEPEGRVMGWTAPDGIYMPR